MGYTICGSPFVYLVQASMMFGWVSLQILPFPLPYAQACGPHWYDLSGPCSHSCLEHLLWAISGEEDWRCLCVCVCTHERAHALTLIYTHIWIAIFLFPCSQPFLFGNHHLFLYVHISICICIYWDILYFVCSLICWLCFLPFSAF